MGLQQGFLEVMEAYFKKSHGKRKLYSCISRGSRCSPRTSHRPSRRSREGEAVATGHTAKTQSRVLSRASHTQDGCPGKGCKTPWPSRVGVARLLVDGAEMGQAGFQTQVSFPARPEGPCGPFKIGPTGWWGVRSSP